MPHRARLYELAQGTAGFLSVTNMPQFEEFEKFQSVASIDHQLTRRTAINYVKFYAEALEHNRFYDANLYHPSFLLAIVASDWPGEIPARVELDWAAQFGHHERWNNLQLKQ